MHFYSIGLDELDTTSSVFEGSECGEPVDEDVLGIPTKIILQKREDVLHKDGGKGGNGQSSTR